MPVVLRQSTVVVYTVVVLCMMFRTTVFALNLMCMASIPQGLINIPFVINDSVSQIQTHSLAKVAHLQLQIFLSV